MHQAWALDEPPSPYDDPDDDRATFRPQTSCSRPSDVGSFQSSGPPGSIHESRWWTFTRPRAAEPSQYMDAAESSNHPAEKEGRRGVTFRDRSMSWLAATHRRSSENSPRPKGFKSHRATSPEHQSDWGLTIDLPPPPSAPFTMAHSKTPGWDTPWTARRDDPTQAQEFFGADKDEALSCWSVRRKRLRMFILTNNYVPLVSFNHGSLSSN